MLEEKQYPPPRLNLGGVGGGGIAHGKNYKLSQLMKSLELKVKKSQQSFLNDDSALVDFLSKRSFMARNANNTLNISSNTIDFTQIDGKLLLHQEDSIGEMTSSFSWKAAAATDQPPSKNNLTSKGLATLKKVIGEVSSQ